MPAGSHQQVRPTADDSDGHVVLTVPSAFLRPAPGPKLPAQNGPLCSTADSERRVWRQANSTSQGVTPPVAFTRRSESNVTSPAPTVSTRSPGRGFLEPRLLRRHQRTARYAHVRMSRLLDALHQVC